MESKQLGPGFTMEILGVDLSAAMSDGNFDAIKKVWLENKVTVFRDQELSDNELTRFTERFGPLFVHVRSQFNDKTRPGIMLISNIKENGRDLGELGNGDLAWHSDQSYSAEPVFATLMYAIEIPTKGGGTWFCDTARAYENLPEATKARIDGLKQNFSIEVTVETQHVALTEKQRQLKPPVTHPLVRTHPELGRKSLYLSPAHSKGLADLPADEGAALLAELEDWAGQPEFTYMHKWRVGDVVMWDNTSTMHRRDAFSADERRLLKHTGFELPPERAVPF
ncbi:MAG: TauD/TfdA family dioxygenase [Pseudomonadota bacterium]|nr:TauD/TfdA family dioxygenase [Pseudomonadota bacterium]